MTGFLNQVKRKAQIFCQVHITPPTSFFYYNNSNLFTSSGKAKHLRGFAFPLIKWKKEFKGEVEKKDSASQLL